jgi:hypothetical protein
MPVLGQPVVPAVAPCTYPLTFPESLLWRIIAPLLVNNKPEGPPPLIALFI